MTSKAPNKKQSTTPPAIVQFFHTGKEFHVKGGKNAISVEAPWNSARRSNRKKTQSASCLIKPSNVNPGSCGGCHDGQEDVEWVSNHYRRLVVHKGEYIDKNGNLISGNLAFWTEWEACTIASCMPRTNDPTGARWFHNVVSPLGKSGAKRINTDPCVFGSTFKYCCCLQHRENERGKDGIMLRNLPKGSVIMFGSKFLNPNAFILDTIFVVGSIRIPYFEGDKPSIQVSDEYRELALRRFFNNERPNTFYRGVSYQDTHGTSPFSFVPARRFLQTNPSCGKRFVLDLAKINKALKETSERFEPNSKQTQGFHSIIVSAVTAEAVWREIVRQVQAAGFVLGVHFDWPK